MAVRARWAPGRLVLAPPADAVLDPAALPFLSPGNGEAPIKQELREFPEFLLRRRSGAKWTTTLPLCRRHGMAPRGLAGHPGPPGGRRPRRRPLLPLRHRRRHRP